MKLFKIYDETAKRALPGAWQRKDAEKALALYRRDSMKSKYKIIKWKPRSEK